MLFQNVRTSRGSILGVGESQYLQTWGREGAGGREILLYLIMHKK